MRNKIFILFLLSVLIFSCKKDKLTEKESNNSFSSANALNLDTAMEGFLNSRDDRDFFKITVPYDIILDISLSGIKGVNHSVRVWENQNRPVLKKLVDDTRKSSPERMINFMARTGVYYISITHGDRDLKKGNTETPYTLIVKSRDPFIEEAEPNDSIETATVIRPEDRYNGYYSPAYNRLNRSSENPLREEDWYCFEIAPENDKTGEDIEDINVLDISLSGVKGVNSFLELYDDSKNLLMKADNNPSGGGETIQGIGAGSGHKFYVLVAADYSSNITEPYELIVQTRKPDLSSELEPNNSMKNANQINLDRISGRITSRKDVDFFIIKNSKENSYLSLKLDLPANIDGAMRIFDSQKKELYKINNSGKGESEIYPCLAESGDFFVEVRSVSGNSSADSEYNLTVTNHEKSENIQYETEDNGNLKKAIKINKDTVIGFVNSQRDTDYYLLEYPQSTKVNFRIKGLKDGKLQVSVTDPHGYTIRRNEINSDYELKISEMIEKKGYLIIKSLQDNYKDFYTINIKEDK